MITTPLGKKCGWAEHQLLAAWLRDEGMRRCGGSSTPNIPSSISLQEVGVHVCRTDNVNIPYCRLQDVSVLVCAHKIGKAVLPPVFKLGGG
jgi:hypothetical protein